MSDDPISSSHGHDEIYYNGTPGFTPRKIRSSKTIGTAGAPPAPPTNRTAEFAATPVVNVKEQQELLQALKPKFDQVGKLLDKKGQSMTLCQNLPPSIAKRYLRQKLEGESCWAFYKRMVAISMEFPDVDVNNLQTTGQQLASHGNDILSDPFSGNTISDAFGAGDYDGLGGEQRTDNFDEDPGAQTLLLMLFIAIIRLITSLIFNVAYIPMQGILGKVNDLYGTKEDKSAGFIGSIPGIGFIAKGVFDAVSAVMTAIGPIGTIIFFEAAKNVALDLIEGIISGGPKLSRDVTRYDALIIASHVRQSSQYSHDLNWPEAAMLYNQYQSLQSQFTSVDTVYNYYSKNSLATSRQGQQGVINAAVMPSDLAQALVMHQNSMNSILDRMIGVLNQDITDTLVCCLIRFLGSQDLRWLQTARGILQLGINRQALVFDSLDTALANLWHTIEKVVLSALLSILYNIFDEINSNLKGDLNAALQSPLFQTNGCPPFNLFVQNMLQFIGGIEFSVLELVVNLNASLQAQDQSNEQYILGLNVNIYQRQLINLIDIILNAQQLGGLCLTSSVPTDAELQSLFEQVKSTMNNGGNNSGSAGGSNNLTVTATNDTLRNQFDQCLSKVPQEKVAEVMAWIQNLTGQSNG